MSDTSSKRGVLLINLGTPDSPKTSDVRRYLREFLSDPRVLDMAAPMRWALLNFVILPFRPRRSARAYASVWMEEGSPLLVHSHRLARRLSDRLGPDRPVEVGMRYGSPSIRDALGRLCDAGAERILAVPLFPQFATSSTGSALACLADAVMSRDAPPQVDAIEPFYAAPGFIDSLATSARPALDAFAADHVLLSYHGLPERHVQRTDRTGSHCLQSEDCCARMVDANALCYRAHCFETSRRLATALRLEESHYSISFQSRLGRDPWIRPFTDEVIPELASRGLRRLAVLCPAFVADCLETLEEIGIRARAQWKEAGGEELLLVPCLNDHPTWVAALAEMIEAREGRG